MITTLEIKPTADETRLNGLEKQWLAVLRERGSDWLGIQPMAFKLGDNCRYHPDFVTLENGQLTAWETKGFMRDDAALKIKMAARTYPFIRFVLVTRVKREWVETEVKA